MVEDNNQMNGKKKTITFNVDDDNNECESKWLWPYPVTGEHITPKKKTISNMISIWRSHNTHNYVA